MDLSAYFEPVDMKRVGYQRDRFLPRLGDQFVTYNAAEKHFPSLNESSLVILGVDEDRGSGTNSGCKYGADEVRRFLYPLALPSGVGKILDLGNIVQGASLEDTHQAVVEVTAELLSTNHTIIYLGGGQDTTFPIYKAYAKLGRIINICSIDSRFDIDEQRHLDSRNYLRHIVMQQPNYLFNFTNIGYQTYFVGEPYINLMEELRFDAYRIGWLQADLERAEPLMRNADCVSVDLGAVRQSDAPGNACPSPHGLYGEELCRLARFAGMSDKTTTFGLFEFNPQFDLHGQTAHMLAHVLWYFIEGVFNRKEDFPYRDPQNYRHITVPLHEQNLEIVFYKSKKSDRWWVQVPCDDDKMSRFRQHLLIPCLYSDYEQALSNKIPDLWWKFYQRINS